MRTLAAHAARPAVARSQVGTDSGWPRQIHWSTNSMPTLWMTVRRVRDGRPQPVAAPVVPSPRTRRIGTLLFAMLFAAATVPAQTLSGAALVKSLQAGGHVIVIRHASSPGVVPDKPNP